MTTTPNLLAQHIISGQSQKEVTANEAFDVFDEAIAGLLIHNFTSDANYTLDVSEPNKEDENCVLKFTDTGTVLTATRDVILPAQRQGHFVWNLTAQSLVVKTASSSSTVTVTAGSKVIVYCDAVDVWDFGSDAAAASTFLSLTDTPSSYSGKANQYAICNGGETGLDFTSGLSGATFWSLPHKGALVSLSADLTAINASSGYTVVWSTETRDTDAFVDLGAQATRITIPSGITRGKLTAGLQFSSFSAGKTTIIKFTKNGSTVFLGNVGAANETSISNPWISIETPVIDVSATDYFEVYIWCEDTSITIESDTSFFAFEVSETTTAANPPYDLGFFYAGQPTNSQEILRYKFPRAATFPASLTGSNSEARVASAGTVVFDLKKNGAAAFGTVTFTTSATGVFAAASETSFAEDDVLTVIAPASADANLADIGFVLKGTRDS